MLERYLKRGRDFKAENEKCDLIQKAAWRFVRSADDRFGDGSKGALKLEWCITRLHGVFPEEAKEHLEDFVRAAYINYRVETRALV